MINCEEKRFQEPPRVPPALPAAATPRVRRRARPSRSRQRPHARTAPSRWRHDGPEAIAFTPTATRPDSPPRWRRDCPEAIAFPPTATRPDSPHPDGGMTALRRRAAGAPPTSPRIPAACGDCTLSLPGSCRPAAGGPSASRNPPAPFPRRLSCRENPSRPPLTASLDDIAFRDGLGCACGRETALADARGIRARNPSRPERGGGRPSMSGEER